jgi:hypothetical protein
MTLLAALDRFVHATHLDFLTPYAGREPRNLRWTPLIALLGVVGGYALLEIYAFRPAAAGENWRWTLWHAFGGGALFWISFGAANLVRLFGPRVTAEQGQLDERELVLRARAGSLSGYLLSLLAVLGCFYCAFAPAFRLWRPETTLDWTYAGLLVEAFAFALPVLVASWLQPSPVPED